MPFLQAVREIDPQKFVVPNQSSVHGNLPLDSRRIDYDDAIPSGHILETQLFPNVWYVFFLDNFMWRRPQCSARVCHYKGLMTK